MLSGSKNHKMQQVRPSRFSTDKIGSSDSPRRGRRVGLLGGSFNPAHGGHRHISLQALDALCLDEVWWLVSPGNPLKSRTDMAALAARYASALRQARRAPIRVTAIEAQLDTRYTVDTLRAIRRRYPEFQFLWLMGADNLATFDHWRAWRQIAQMMPIAVIARPGYDGQAIASPAVAWLRRFQVPAAKFRAMNRWSAPALVILRFNPDPRSATAIRRAEPDWAAKQHAATQRDMLTHRLIDCNEAAPRCIEHTR